jgi:predicted Zn-ribbon and HTH transcriptional regulator
MGTVEKTVTFYVCERCGHEWYPRGAGKPTVCPKCKSPYWDKARQSPKKDAN